MARKAVKATEPTMDEKLEGLDLMTAEERTLYLREHPEVMGELCNRHTQHPVRAAALEARAAEQAAASGD